MSIAEYYRLKEQEMIQLAQRYERCPEDEQKAEGARQARKDAAFFRRMAEKEEGKDN